MVDVALYEAVFNMMESLVPEYDVAGVVRDRGALPGIVPSNTYARRPERGHRRQRRRHLPPPDAGHRPRGPADPDLARNDGRARRVEEIDGAIQQWCGGRDIDEALGTLKRPMCPWARSTAWPTCSPIRSSWRAA